MGFARLFLALVVACDHLFVVALIPAGHGTRGVDQWVWFNGGFAVYFFYVLSGFLISYALAGRYRDSTVSFFISRFVRIFSLYWPLLLIACLFYPYGKHDLLDRIATVVLFGSDWLVTFRGGNPNFDVLGIAWALGAELTFYAMAPWLLRSHKVAGLVFASSLALRVYLQHRFGFSAWTYQFFPSAICFFLAGHFARLAATKWPLHFFGPLALFVSLLSIRATLTTGSWLSPWFLIGAGCFAVSLPWLFATTSKWRFSNYLADLGYPIYLCHGFVMAFASICISKDWLAASSVYEILPCYIGALLVTAAAVHLLVERPVGAMMKSFLDSSLRRTPDGPHRASRRA